MKLLPLLKFVYRGLLTGLPILTYNPITKFRYNYRYKLNYTDEICDNIRCKCIYLNANDEYKNYYKRLPLYKREDNKCKLCIECIEL